LVLYRFIVDETKCMNCGACMDLCPFTCIEFTRPDDVSFYGGLYSGTPVDEFEESGDKEWMMEKPYVPMQDRCTGCQMCVRECPTNAIVVIPDAGAMTVRPKPSIVRKDARLDDGTWHPLSELTRDYLKRPVRSPWFGVTDWKPTTKEREVHQTWRSMKEDN
jgi:ferredoxin